MTDRARRRPDGSVRGNGLVSTLDPASGRMATGFVTVDGKTYFLKDDGRMLTEAAEFVPDANGALSLKK